GSKVHRCSGSGSSCSQGKRGLGDALRWRVPPVHRLQFQLRRTGLLVISPLSRLRAEPRGQWSHGAAQPLCQRFGERLDGFATRGEEVSQARQLEEGTDPVAEATGHSKWGLGTPSQLARTSGKLLRTRAGGGKDELSEPHQANWVRFQ